MGFEEEDGRFDPKNERFQARLLKIKDLDLWEGSSGSVRDLRSKAKPWHKHTVGALLALLRGCPLAVFKNIDFEFRPGSPGTSQFGGMGQGRPAPDPPKIASLSW